MYLFNSGTLGVSKLNYYHYHHYYNCYYNDRPDQTTDTEEDKKIQESHTRSTRFLFSRHTRGDHRSLCSTPPTVSYGLKVAVQRPGRQAPLADAECDVIVQLGSSEVGLAASCP